MKKKLFVVLLAGVLCSAFTACAGSAQKTLSEKEKVSSSVNTSVKAEESLEHSSENEAGSSATHTDSFSLEVSSVVENGELESGESDESRQNSEPDVADSSEPAAKDADESFSSAATASKAGGKKQIPAYSVPESVQKLTDEEEAAVVGTIKDGVYENSFFDFSLTAPDGWSLGFQDYDDSSVDPMSLTEMVGKGYGGVFVSAAKEGKEEKINLFIKPCGDEQLGQSEQALVEARCQSLRDIYITNGWKDELPEMRTVTFAGGQHPAVYTYINDEVGETEQVDLFLPKDGLYVQVTVTADAGDLAGLLSAFGKI